MYNFNLFNHPICFTYPLRVAPSAWVKHVPFAMFLIDILRPKTVVELGTYYGVSYCAFCQAVKELKIDTQCYAIDTWQGDIHAGSYGPEVLEDLQIHHDPLYSSFSRLIQSTFDEALDHFGYGSIDLLHIDGFHTYESVMHDFQSWLPKMSSRGVILFHDINVRERGFGVWKLWEKLKLEYKSFELRHEHGLGLLAVGQLYSEPLQQLLTSSDNEAVLIRDFFYQLGVRIENVEVQTLRRIVREQSDCIKRLRSLSAPRKIVVDPKIYEAYLGVYMIGPDQVMVITKEDNKLMCKLMGQLKFELLSASDTYFFVENAEAEVVFCKDDRGRVTHLILRLINKELRALKVNGGLSRGSHTKTL
jgi:hypothetical protein